MQEIPVECEVEFIKTLANRTKSSTTTKKMPFAFGRPALDIKSDRPRNRTHHQQQIINQFYLTEL